MFAISLQSGSNGNCFYVEAGGVRLLVDAGISGVQAESRLAREGIDIRSVDALLISHDHRDHCSAMGIYQRKFGVPIYVTARTFRMATAMMSLGRMEDVRHFEAGQTLRFDGVSVETIPTPHDAAEGVGFVIDDGRWRLGILTDLGHVFEGLDSAVGGLDAVILESNYDPEMLEGGPYPRWLKERIRGPEGHLSNVEAGQLLRRSAGTQLRWACLAHLSADNNSPDLALRTCHEILGGDLPLHLSGRHAPTDVLEIC